jgi:hypothetical protein
MVEDELAPKTIHNAVMLLRNMLAGRKGPSAFRRGLSFADHTLGVKLPPLEYRQNEEQECIVSSRGHAPGSQAGNVGQPRRSLHGHRRGAGCRHLFGDRSEDQSTERRRLAHARRDI